MEEVADAEVVAELVDGPEGGHRTAAADQEGFLAQAADDVALVGEFGPALADKLFQGRIRGGTAEKDGVRGVGGKVVGDNNVGVELLLGLAGELMGGEAFERRGLRADDYIDTRTGGRVRDVGSEQAQGERRSVSATCLKPKRQSRPRH